MNDISIGKTLGKKYFDRLRFWTAYEGKNLRIAHLNLGHMWRRYQDNVEAILDPSL